MKLLLVSLLVALPALAYEDVLFELVGMRKAAVKECALAAGVTEDQYAQILSAKELPDDEDVTCKLIMCQLQDSDLLKDGKFDRAAMKAKAPRDFPAKLISKAAPSDFLQCADLPAEGLSACQEAKALIYCVLYKAVKYASPLLDTFPLTFTRCQKENNVTDDEANAIAYKAWVPKSTGVKCMLACLLKDKGAVFEDKLDVEYIAKKILNDLDQYPPLKNISSVITFMEDIQKCSPNVTDPSGTKDVCEGAYDLYNCIYKTEKKYFLGGILRS